MTAERCTRCGAEHAPYRLKRLDRNPICAECLTDYDILCEEIIRFALERRRAFVGDTDLGHNLKGHPWLGGNIL